MKKKPHGRILKEQPKKQHLSIVPNAMFESLEEEESRGEQRRGEQSRGEQWG